MTNARAVEAATQDIEAITGQHPIVTRAKKSVANFRVRDGMIIGTMVTLRGARMYEFLDRLLNAALPRIRDFRGVSNTAFDGRGNYSLGFTEQTLFPEIDYDKMDRQRGLQVTIVTSAKRRRGGEAVADHVRHALRPTGLIRNHREGIK